MTKIKMNGTWFLEEIKIKDGVVWAFRNLLIDPGDWRPSMNGLSFDGLRD